MSDISVALKNKTFATLLSLLALGTVTLSLIFSYVSSSQLGVEEGLALFIASTLLLILCYLLGVIIAGFLAIFVLTRLWSKTAKP